MKNSPIVLRKYQADSDKGYVLDSYLRALRACDEFRTIPTGIFYEIWRPQAEKLISGYQGIVAALEEDPSYIFGFIFWKTVTPKCAMVSFAYVREMYRGAKIFSMLLKKSGCLEKKCLVAFGTNPHTKKFIEEAKFPALIVGPYASYLVETGVIPNEDSVCSVLAGFTNLAQKRTLGEENSSGSEPVRECIDVR